MHVLMFLPSLAGGGAERTVVNLANEFSNKGHHVELLIGKELEDELRSSKYRDLLNQKVTLTELDVSATAKNAIRLIFSLRQQIKEKQPDVIFTTRMPANLLMIFAKYGVRDRGKLIIRESVYRSSTIKSKIKRNIIGFFYNKADAVVALSSGVARDLVDNFRVSPFFLKTIYNPVDLKFIAEKSSSYQREDNSYGPKFVFLGRFDAQKSPMDAILAFEVIQREYPTASLSMYGVGPLVAEVAVYIESKSSAKNIRYFGFTDNPYAILDASDFMLMPSKYEGFGHVITEALACSCVPVVYDCPYGPSEILVGELDELLVPVGDWKGMADKALTLLKDSSKCRKFQDIGVSLVQKYNSESIADEYLKFFEKNYKSL
jgi:glycosyltransferase involved in cell wall biosynthesis